MFQPTTITAREGQVAHGFLTRADPGRPLFVSYHAPARSVRTIAYVICPPLGWEGIQCYHSVRLLAEGLAAAGFHAMRMHYDGTGESAGSDADPARVPAWLESVRRAVAALAELPGVEGVGLIGIRLGATLAGQVSSELELANLVLWEPCVAGAHYTREMEILASAAPGAARTDPARDGLEAGGYVLTRETIDGLNALDLAKVTVRGKPDVLLIHRHDRPPVFGKKLKEHLERLGCATTLEQMPGYTAMMVYPEKSKPALADNERIRDWAIERSRVAAVETPGTLALDEGAIEGGVRHRPVRFGADDRLFGVITEPASPRAGAPRPVVILLTGGIVPRTAVNRMYVVIARRLAELGHAVLRMDISGICESPAAEGAAPNDPHAASILDDVRSAVQSLAARPEIMAGIWVVGLCSGAYAAFQTTLAEPRIRGAVPLNPAVFHINTEAPELTHTQQLESVKQYRQALLDPGKWKKLLSGKANVRYMVTLAGARIKALALARRDRIAARIAGVPKGLAGDFHRLLTRGVKLSVVFSEGDPGQESLISQLASDLDPLRAKGLHWKTFAGADHVFNEIAVRSALLDWIVDTVSETGAKTR